MNSLVIFKFYFAKISRLPENDRGNNWGNNREVNENWVNQFLQAYVNSTKGKYGSDPAQMLIKSIQALTLFYIRTRKIRPEAGCSYLFQAF